MSTVFDNRDSGESSPQALLSVRDLKVYFQGRHMTLGAKTFIKAVDGVSFDIPKGETLALVGESGCGKTTTARSIVRLVEPTSGSIVFEDFDIAGLRKSDLKNYRRRVQFVFQDPYESLNPRQRIFDALATPIRIHHLASTRSELSKQVYDLLLDVNLEPKLTCGKFPHELSGGQRQRINIARALATKPDLIIADEPVSMLDVSLRMGVLSLLEHLRKTRGLTFLFITHDMAAARQITNRIAVMYLGKIVELGDADSIIGHPIHPYSKLVVEATPTIELDKRDLTGNQELDSSDTDAITSAQQLPPGCRFQPRCKFAIEKCKTIEPPLLERRPRQMAACDVVSVEN
ncbi:MAG: oligopeptide/dipeptide ABC transporter ATP-binding protein [Candidatus Bathyarchaeia archaeon]